MFAHRTTGGMRSLIALIASLASGCVFNDAPDAGTLETLHVPPAEAVEVRTLGRGQTFGEMLQGTVPGGEQAALLLAFQERASAQRMRPGTEISFRFERGEGALRGVDVSVNRDETVRLTRGPAGWRSESIETPVFVDTLFASGEIETVLWSAVVGHPALATMPTGDRSRMIDYLDRVFQWQVDFSRQIRAGDTYRFAFEREVRPDGSFRSGRLLAAELVNSGTPFHAVWFDPNGDGEGSYYDLEGESVRRAFLLKPLAYRRISSRFSNGRFHPVLQRWRAHRGVDYAADTGTEIMATADGVVIQRGWNGGFGNSIEIRHPNGFVTRYAHLSRFRGDVTLGSRVRQGDIIGYVGMTGLATGPHLHYEMMRGGQHMDPLSVELPAGDPVPSDDRLRWREEMEARVALLETVPRAGPVRLAMSSGGGAGPAGSNPSSRSD